MSTGRDPDTVSTYEAMAGDYTAELDESPFNALYERPGVIALLPDVAGKRVLDVECGSGPLSEWLVCHGAEVVGFDSSPSMVQAAKSRGLSDVLFRVADLARPLTFLPDSSFDVAVASLVMHYLATELLHDRWEKRGRECEVSFWRRPLSAMFQSFDAAGFNVQTLSEPRPLPECEQRFPDAWKRLTTRPHFLFLRLRPHGASIDTVCSATDYGSMS